MYYTGAIAKTLFYYETVLPHVIFNMSCNGNEDSLYNCTYSNELPSGSTCYSFEDASVICQGIIVNEILVIGYWLQTNSK